MIITHINPWLAIAFIALATLYFVKACKYRKLKFQLEETGFSHRTLVRQLDDVVRQKEFFKKLADRELKRANEYHDKWRELQSIHEQDNRGNR